MANSKLLEYTITGPKEPEKQYFITKIIQNGPKRGRGYPHHNKNYPYELNNPNKLAKIYPKNRLYIVTQSPYFSNRKEKRSK